MAKRFTDTMMYDKEWFRALSPASKCLWEWLLKKCDIAGIVDIDLGLASFQIGATFKREDLEVFKERLLHLKNNKYFLAKFIDFQYGELSESCKPHMAVIKILNKNNIKWSKSKGYTKGIHSNKDKDKDKDKDKEKESVQEFDFDAVYKIYPRKAGKTKGIEKCINTIKDLDKYNSLLQAVKNYSAICEVENTEQKYIKMFSTFMGCWEDYIDIDVPLTKEQEKSKLDQQMIAFFQNAERKADDNKS